MGKNLSDLKKLFDDPARFRLAKRLSRQDVKEQSRWVIRTILWALAEAGRNAPSDRNKIAAWIAAAKALGASVQELAEGDRDQVMYDWVTRTIFFDPEQDDWTICKQICHELAHHVICHHHGGQIRHGIERYDDNRESLQHRIAREVELYFFGRQANISMQDDASE